MRACKTYGQLLLATALLLAATPCFAADDVLEGFGVMFATVLVGLPLAAISAVLCLVAIGLAIWRRPGRGKGLAVAMIIFAFFSAGVFPLAARYMEGRMSRRSVDEMLEASLALWLVDLISIGLAVLLIYRVRSAPPRPEDAGQEVQT
jgi:hypothetical protein